MFLVVDILKTTVLFPFHFLSFIYLLKMRKAGASSMTVHNPSLMRKRYSSITRALPDMNHDKRASILKGASFCDDDIIPIEKPPTEICKNGDSEALFLHEPAVKDRFRTKAIPLLRMFE